MPDLTGQSLGRYHILEPLGEGGMAVVYKAYDTRLEREVAVKVIRTERLTEENKPRALKRFEREAKSLGKLTHPNIVPISDYGEYEGKPYLVMPYLPGGTLKDRLGRQWPWQEAVRLLLPIVNGLEYAHEQGLVHRDIKPSNILITQKGQPMLSDFGVAKLLDAEETVELTATGAGVGTPEYMAPEQATSRAVDGRADIYSLGIVLYEMVVGRKPFQADTPMAVMIMHARDPLPRPRSFIPSLPQEVENVLLKALAKKPEGRYEDMGRMAQALEGLLSGKVKAVPRPEPVRKPQPRTERPVEQKKAAPPLKAMEKREAKKSSSIPRVVGLGLVGIAAVAGLVYWGLSLKGAGAASPPATKAPAEATATQEAGSIWARPADGMQMVFVPEGPFSMGSEQGEDEEKPVHTVTLDAFWIDKTEVTNGMHAKCVQAGVCSEPPNRGSANRSNYYRNMDFHDYPVVFVTWEDARTYCEWAGARLPTEAEWEKAARGTDGRIYPWGEGIDCSLANYSYTDGTCRGDTNKAGSYPEGASPYGALDMAGNVFEWVADWYSAGYYYVSPANNPHGPGAGRERVFRGGSWNLNSNSARTSFREASGPAYLDDQIGFRCARSENP